MVYSPLERLNILVIDNDISMVDLVKYTLESFGFKDVNSAKDGSSALKIMHSKKIDLVITDWMMDPMDGIEFVKYLRTNEESPSLFIPIIMLSGRAEKDNIQIARDAGITEFIAKPFTVEKFREIVISVIESPREFVFSGDFIGPSRRRRTATSPNIDDRRGQ